MKKIVLSLAITFCCTSALADVPPLCPSAADMRTAQFMSNPVYNVSLFSSVDNGLVIVNGPTPQTAQLLLSQTIAPYTLTAQPISIIPGETIYYCAYAPGMNSTPSQSSMGIYWIDTKMSSTRLLSELNKKTK